MGLDPFGVSGAFHPKFGAGHESHPHADSGTPGVPGVCGGAPPALDLVLETTGVCCMLSTSKRTFRSNMLVTTSTIPPSPPPHEFPLLTR